MLPSDLLFEYNSAELRESARVGLMKLALLVERNPGLYCWIEGYTDLFGTESYNLELSRRRAESVKSYLTGSLKIDGKRIETRGFGKSDPLVNQGDIDQQAPNRRVEIKMRRTQAPPQMKARPEAEATLVRPQANPGMEETPEAPPKAILVKPARTLPVEPEAPMEESVPRAQVVEEEPAPRARVVEEEAPPKARVVEEEPADPPRAVPVEEEAPRAVPVEE
nr:OmpA family protein [Haloferula luteola]